MGAAWGWASRELRRRARATISVALLIGVSGAVVLTAAAGARRTETAFDRALVAARTADVRLQYTSEEPVDDAVLTALRSHPDVELATPIFFTLGTSEASGYDLTVVAGPDVELFTAVDRLEPIEGRLPDPRAADEVAVNRFAATSLGVGVGDTVELATLTPEQLERESFGEPGGPRLHLTVVGVTRFPDDVADPEFLGIFGTPAFHEATAGRAASFGPSLEILVRDGVDGEAVVREALDGIALDEVETTTRASLASQVEDGAHALAVGLTAFAAAAAIATLVAAGQALGRRLAETAPDQTALHVAVGVPLGIAVGRVAWRATTSSLGLDPTPAVPLVWLIALVPATGVVAALVATIPGRLASRLTAAEALRVE